MSYVRKTWAGPPFILPEQAEMQVALLSEKRKQSPTAGVPKHNWSQSGVKYIFVNMHFGMQRAAADSWSVAATITHANSGIAFVVHGMCMCTTRGTESTRVSSAGAKPRRQYVPLSTRFVLDNN